MKPRIRKQKGVWVCKLRATVNGYGTSARQAYHSWKWANRIGTC